MRRRTRRTWILVFLLLAIVAGSAETSAQRGPLVPVAAEVHASIQRHGAARVIVELRTALHTPEGDLASPSAVVAQRHGVAAARGRMLAGLAATGHRVLREFATVPFVALEVGEDALRALEASAFDVVRVVEDTVFFAQLNVAGPLVQVDRAWARGFDGSGTTIAVLDTGVDASHPFFSGRIVEEACFTSGKQCPNGQSTQTGPGAGAPCQAPGCHHGTHVAGVALGDGAGSGVSFSGMAPGAMLMSVQIFTDIGREEPGAYFSDVMAALEHVYSLRDRHQFAAINLSVATNSVWTYQCDYDAMKPIIDNLRSVGIATVVAAGNNGAWEAMSSPACISSAVSVAASGMTDIIASFTNVAAFTSLFAPGLSLQSSVPGGGFFFMSGTSAAAPHVAGAWAVLKQAIPEASVTQVLTALQETGVPITDTRPGGKTTRPRIRVANALDQLIGPETTPPVVAITAPANGATVSGTVTLAATASDNVGVVAVRFTLDGADLGAADTWAPYSMSWNTASTPPGAHTVTAVATDAAGNTATSAPITVTVANTAPQPVVWTSVVKAAVSGNSITKNAGCDGCSDTGAISQQTIASGSGFVEFKVSANAYLSVGLSTGNPGTSSNEIKFALRFFPGAVQVRESGVYQAAWTPAAGAFFKIAVEGGAVKYYEDGVLKYTSTLAPAYPLLVDTSLLTLGAGVQSAVMSTAAGGSPPGPPDPTPPTVAITAPATGSGIEGTVTVSAAASDNVGVIGVQFKLDGVDLGAEDTTAPYAVALNTATAAAGWHTLTAVARDAAGNMATAATVYVFVVVSGPLTTAKFTSPSQGATLSGIVTVGMAVENMEGPVWFTFKVDDLYYSRQTATGSTASYQWDTSTVINGSHTLSVIAQNNAGRWSSSAMTVNVANGDTTPPTVALTAPANGATVSGTVTISATASGNVGVAGVQFKVNGVNVGSEDIAAPYAIAWNTTTVANGTYTVTALARDTSWNTTTSAPVTVTVANGDPTPPTVAITAPANGATVSGTITVSATASDDVGVAGVQFMLDGAPVGAEDPTAPYGITWDTTTVANGTHTLAAVARDAAGNTATSAPVSVTIANGVGPQPVVWTNAVKVAVSGNTITKNAGCGGCADAGAISQQMISSGTGFVEFGISSGATLTAGLSSGNPGTSGSEITFGLRFYPGSPGIVEVRESGVYKWDWQHVADAVYKVAVEGGVVKYYQNGALKYTSAQAPSSPLLLDTSLLTVGSAVQNAVIATGP